jgi:anti-sigma regulatory factor (Ser/Thr protein kinase)
MLGHPTTPTDPRVMPTALGVRSSLRVPADLRVVAFVRCAIACVLDREDWPAESASLVLLASSEALTNAIEHGSPADGRVDIDLDVTRDRADIRIVDQGVPGTATPRLPSGPPPVTAERGRGLLIISRIADDFEMVPAGGGTEVHVGFWRHAAAEEADEVALGARAA